MPVNELEAMSPVNEALDTGSKSKGPAPGIALCLSGGGYRAMVFHIGCLWRLNEMGYLKKLDRISSVSGGSITAGLLGFNWKKLEFDGNGVATNFIHQVVRPIREMAGKTIDEGAIFGGMLGPGSIGEKVINAYEKHLFGNATLQDLPDDPPRFVINATNVQTGALFRFMKPYARDYKVGKIPKPKIRLSVAVAASSAFPPFLSPIKLELKPSDYSPAEMGDLGFEPYTTDVVLSDGGVYDNLGLETAWKRYETILVSDAGGQMQPEPEPKSDWPRHAQRVIGITDNQVRSLRKRQLIYSYQHGIRKGTYWGIRTNIADYGLADALPCPFDKTTALAETKTRLKRMEPGVQERLINWGYAVCDAGMRKWVAPRPQVAPMFPYPAAGL
jgi:NTE family protein